MKYLLSFIIITLLFPLAALEAQQGTSSGLQKAPQTGVQLGERVDEMELLREEIANQIFLYKEVMEHLKDISEKFSDGYLLPDEALKKVTVLRHAYNSEAKPVPNEAKKLVELVNQMFSRLENYYIYFKKSFRERSDLNAKIAESKFRASQEAERLEYTYLS